MNDQTTPIYRKASSDLFFYKIVGKTVIKVSLLNQMYSLERSNGLTKESEMQDLLECNSGYVVCEENEFLNKYTDVFNLINPLAL